MADFALTGKKGTGKSKNGIRIMRDRYFAQKRRVATNLDVFLEPMFGPMSRQTYVRLPDKPTAFDLEAAGHGNPDSYDEDRNAMMLLDELGTWLNTRTFGDKDRAGMLDWLAHARKHGYDCWYVMQNISQVDKQLREAFIEFTVRHVRFDKVAWPVVGGVLGALFGERAAFMPRFHSAVTRLGTNPQDLVTARTWFIADDLNACYDTRQVFRADYPHGTHSVLSPWHVKGRYMQAEKKSVFAWLRSWLAGVQARPVAAPVRPAAGGVATVRERLQAAVAAGSLSPDRAVSLLARYLRRVDQGGAGGVAVDLR